MLLVEKALKSKNTNMTNLYDSLLERLSGREYGNYFACLCPFHPDRSPSCFVYEDGFRCAACGKRGSLKQLDRKIGSHFRPTKNDTVSNVLPNWKRWEFEYGDLQGIAEHAHKTLKRFPQFQGYLKKRRINEYIEKGFLGYCDGWVTIPVRDVAGKIIDIACRAVKGKGGTRYVVRPSKVAGHPAFCPNWKETLASETIYVVYGLVDALGLAIMGFPVVTGMTGKSLSAELLLPLRKKFLIVPDAGEEREAHLLANQLGWRGRVKELNYPVGTKDCAGVREMYGDEILKELLQ